MLYIILSIIVLGVLTAAFEYFGNKRRKRKGTPENAEEEKVTIVSTECCGQHEVCERDSLLAAVSKKIEYYDDEELDSYRGNTPDSYSEKSVDEFREVLYTLKEVEVAGWLRSLQLRGINLPDQLKDEALMIVEERRTK